MKRLAETNNQQLGKDAEMLVFGEFRIDLARRVLIRDDNRIRIQKKPLDVLIYLIREAPRMVPREELLERFWSRAVNDEVLTRCVSTIRKHLDDKEDPPRFIETHRAQGYRFIADVEGAAPGEPVSPVPAGRGRRTLAATAVILVMLVLAVSFWPAKAPDEAASGRVGRIAVLPVVVPGTGVEWLKPALSDHLIRAISRIEGVTVVSSNADADSLDISAHGEALSVEALLLTRLQQTVSGSSLSAQLVAVDDNALLWSAVVESDNQFSSSDQVQELARQLATRLRPTLQLGDQKPNVDQRAYSYYLQGRYYWAQRSAISLEAAIAAYDAALEIDADYTDALLGSAESWLLLPLYGAMAPDEAIPTARQLAKRALELDPVSARARAVLGSISMQYDWNWREAESLLREAVSLDPNDATAQQWLGELFCQTARFEECTRQLRVAFELDPLSPVLRMQQGSPALYSGDYSAALSFYSDATRKAPEYPLGRYVLGLAYAGLSDWDRAIVAYRSAMPDLGLAIVGGPLVFALSRAGADQEARQLLAELETLTTSRYVPPSKLAVAYLGLGDRERALAELGRAIKAHDDRLVYFKTDVHFRNLVTEPGFRDIARQIGL